MEKQRKPVPDVECLKYHGTPEKPDIKIFVSHRIDLDSETIDNSLHIPVRCGAIFDKREGITMLGDDTGDNISEKRNSFCELTVQYWAWKNIEADYYGLCHYRRYFSFSQEKYIADKTGVVKFSYLSDCVKDFLLEDIDVIRSAIQPYDLLLGSGYDYYVDNRGTLYTQYELSPDHLHVKDMKCAISVLKEFYPEFSDSADLYMNDHILYPCNMFIMKKNLFCEYCSWLFTILEEVERRIDTSKYSESGKRTLAYIAERLLGIYYTYIHTHCPQYRTNILQRSLIEDTSVLKYPAPAFSEKNVPIVFACSDYFAPYTAEVVQSLIEYSTSNYNYDLIFLHTGISERNQIIMKSMVSNLKNFSLRFFNISKCVRLYNLPVHHQYSVETYYRLLIPEFLYKYDKVIYLDSDLTVLRNIADLFEIDIGDNLLAATIDIYISGQYNGDYLGTKNYCDNVLCLKNPYLYFQAGVIVINAAAFRDTFRANDLLQCADTHEYRFVDQDILNEHCNGRVYILPMNWNVMTDCSGSGIELIKQAPKLMYEEYMNSRVDPYIIHHTGGYKPWDYPEIDCAEFYWKYARKTPFYETVLWRYAHRIKSGN